RHGAHPGDGHLAVGPGHPAGGVLELSGPWGGGAHRGVGPHAAGGGGGVRRAGAVDGGVPGTGDHRVGAGLQHFGRLPAGRAGPEAAHVSWGKGLDGMAAGDSAHPEGRIVLEEREGIAVITLDRPEMRNAMSTAMWRQLEAVCRGLADRDEVGAVVLRGAGPTFCAGMDLYEMNRLSLEEAEQSFQAMDRAIRALEELPQPTVGLLRGVA